MLPIKKEAFFMTKNAKSIRKNELSHGQYIAVLAMLIALGIVLKTVTIYLSSTLKISFTFIPEAITAVLLGPWATIIQAALTDVIGIILFPTDGGFVFQFTISAIVSGAITGFCFSKKLTLKRIVLSRILVNAIVYIVLNSIWMEQVYGLPFKVRIMTQFIKCPITGACEIILLSILLPAIINAIKRFGFNNVEIQDNIHIANLIDLRRRFGLPVLEAILSLFAVCPLLIPCIDLTYQGTKNISYIGFFEVKLFDGNLVLDYKILAIMLIPILLTTACFLLSFSKKHALKISLGLLNAISLIAVFNLVLVPYLSKIEGLSSDYSGIGIIFTVYAILAVIYVIASLLQKELGKKAKD